MAETVRRSRATVTLISTVAATGGLLFGFDTGVISGALPFLRDRWQLGSGQIEALTTAVLVGAVLGSLLSGRVTDILGRKKVMLFTAVVFLVGAVWTGLAGSPESLGLGRGVVGLAIGVASFATPLYIAEIAPTRRRGALVSLNQLMITIGILVSYAADYALANDANLDSWRWMFLAGAVPAVVLFVGMLFLPETPRWLVAQGREAEGRAVLERVEDPDLVDEAIRRMKEDAAAESRIRRGGRPRSSSPGCGRRCSSASSSSSSSSSRGSTRSSTTPRSSSRWRASRATPPRSPPRWWWAR